MKEETQPKHRTKRDHWNKCYSTTTSTTKIAIAMALLVGNGTSYILIISETQKRIKMMNTVAFCY